MESSKKKKSKKSDDLNDFLKSVIEEEDSYFSNHYKTNESKPTDIILKTTGKPTEEIPANTTENLRKTVHTETKEEKKPTDKPTGKAPDDIRKITVKPTDINCLVGFQRTAFFWLVNEAKEFGFSDSEGNRITPSINGNTFAKTVLFKSYKQAKDVIYELKASGYLKTHFIKNGRGGFVQFLIEKELYQEVLLNQGKVKPTDNIRITYGIPTDKPTDTPTEMVLSKKEDLFKNTYILTESLKRIGLSERLLQSITRNEIEVQEILNHFSYSIENGEIKSPNRLAVLLSVLKDETKNWVSEGYLKQIEREIENAQNRVGQVEQLKKQEAELKLKEKYFQFLEENPFFVDEVKKENKFINSQEIAENIAFAKFKELNS